MPLMSVSKNQCPISYIFSLKTELSHKNVNCIPLTSSIESVCYSFIIVSIPCKYNLSQKLPLSYSLYLDLCINLHANKNYSNTMLKS